MKIKKMSAAVLIAFNLATVFAAESLACPSESNSTTSSEVSKSMDPVKNDKQEITYHKMPTPRRDRAP